MRKKKKTSFRERERDLIVKPLLFLPSPSLILSSTYILLISISLEVFGVTLMWIPLEANLGLGSVRICYKIPFEGASSRFQPLEGIKHQALLEKSFFFYATRGP